MGVILQGILGGFSGKVGPVVGGKWKDIDYMRGYVVPENPNTPAQQGQRARFATVVAGAKALLSTILQPFWDFQFSSMSGFNAFVSRAVKIDLTETDLLAGTETSVGSLTPILSIVPTYTSGTGVVAFTWDENLVGNALASDTVMCAIYNKVTATILGTSILNQRDDEGCNVTIAIGLDETNLVGFAFPYRGTGSEMLVAPSVMIDVTTP
jgi:hypothetical protein